MLCVLFVTAFALGFLMAIVPFAIPFLVALLVIYTCQAIFYRKYVTLFTQYYTEAGYLGHTHPPQVVMAHGGAPLDHQPLMMGQVPPPTQTQYGVIPSNHPSSQQVL